MSSKMPTVPKNRRPRQMLVRGIPADIYEALQALAKEDHRSVNAYVVVLIEAHVRAVNEKR